MKALGTTIREFFKDENWPRGYYLDDSEVDFYDDGGNWILDDAKEYDLAHCGYLAPDGNTDTQGEVVSFSVMFRRWLKVQTHVTISVSVPKEKEMAVRLAIQDALKGARR